MCSEFGDDERWEEDYCEFCGDELSRGVCMNCDYEDYNDLNDD